MRFLRWALMGLGVLALVAIAFAFLRQRDHPGDREQIERVLRYSATSGDPDLCAYATPSYLRQVNGVPEIYADGACRSSVESADPADSIKIDHMVVDGYDATARVTAIGGAAGGSTYTVTLSKGDGSWKLSRLVRFDHFDRASLRRAHRRALLADGWTAGQVGCAIAAERRLSGAAVEAIVLHPGPNPVQTAEVSCARDQIERSVLTTMARLPLSRLPDRARCATAHLRAADDSALESIAFDPVGYGRLVLTCDPRAPFDFMRAELLAHEFLDPAGADCVIEAARRLSRADAYRLTYENRRYDAIIDSCRSETSS